MTCRIFTVATVLEEPDRHNMSADYGAPPRVAFSSLEGAINYVIELIKDDKDDEDADDPVVLLDGDEATTLDELHLRARTHFNKVDFQRHAENVADIQPYRPFSPVCNGYVYIVGAVILDYEE